MVDQGKVGACRQSLASNPGLGPMVGLHPGFLGFGCPHSSLPAGLNDACRECGARALELVRKLQDPEALQKAQPGLTRPPLQDLLQLGQVRWTAVALSGPGSVGGQLWAGGAEHPPPVPRALLPQPLCQVPSGVVGG